jgi:choline dehydrogenase-like flavoprotein
LQPRPLITEVKIQTIVEAEPNRDSRVTLSDKKDSLGLNRVKVDWQVTELVKRTFDRTVKLIAEELQRGGVADVELDEPLEGKPWPAQLEGTWHHMGTTRMHDSPKEGVVDRNCKVHGMSNFYIAGSSVFPTVGANFPTITIAAMTLRLSEHIAYALKNADAGATVTAISAGEHPQQEEPLPFAASTLHMPSDLALEMGKK